MTLKLQRILLLLIATACVAPAWAQRGALTIPRNLDQMTDRAAVIVRGQVVSAHVEKHPELQALDTIVVTLRVTQALKGDTGSSFTFRQYVWDFRDRRAGLSFHKGQDLILLMNAPSRYGLSSPVGMEQGRFRISRDRFGKEVAVNGRGNVMLLRGIGAALAEKGVALSPSSSGLVTKHQKGPIAASELTALIRELARDRG